MPWAHVPSHLLALSAGVGTAMSSFAQVSMFWLLYAHHWPACFLDGGRDVNNGTPTMGNAFRIFATVCIAIAALGWTVHAFLSWLSWVWTVERNEVEPASKQTRPKKDGRQVKLMVVVPGQDDPDEWDEPDEEPEANSADMVRVFSRPSADSIRASSHQSGDSKHSRHSRFCGRPGTAALEARVLDLSASLIPMNGSDQGDASEVSRTWEQTLTSLWDYEDQEDDEQDDDENDELESGVERTRPGDARWAITGGFPGQRRTQDDHEEEDWRLRVCATIMGL
mmetsp:Transcript_50924/g.101220  ORF Transcript_50924/g.101220 Transcript_50924/m.101220 type:complete len:281 (+) Transcript_50924:77-919(+)